MCSNRFYNVHQDLAPSNFGTYVNTFYDKNPNQIVETKRVSDRFCNVLQDLAHAHCGHLPTIENFANLLKPMGVKRWRKR